jgi:hypothetical protein
VDDDCPPVYVHNLFNCRTPLSRKGVYRRWCVCVDTRMRAQCITHRPHASANNTVLVDQWVCVSVGRQSWSVASSSGIGSTWPDTNLSTLTQNSLTNGQSISACAIISICWPHYGHTGDTEVKAASFAAVQYAFVCIVHSSERIFDISVLWWTYRHTVSDSAISDVAAAGEDDCC